MEKKIYLQLVQSFFDFIETKIEEEYEEIEIERAESILKINLNNSEIIINTQEPLNQIWIASKKNGYHFSYQDSNWYDKRNNLTIENCLKTTFKEQYNIELTIFD